MEGNFVFHFRFNFNEVSKQLSIIFHRNFYCAIRSVVFCAKCKKREYYDEAKRVLKEEYYVKLEDMNTMHGEYKRYYEDGDLAAKGFFRDGLKDTTFLEFYPNGNTKIIGTLSFW